MLRTGFIDIPSHWQSEEIGRKIEWQWIEGHKKKPVLVLLHEGLGCVASWKAFPGRLAAATGCGVLSYSRFGYGASSPTDLPRQVDYMHREADNLAHVLCHVSSLSPTQNVVLVGHSDGASIAAIYAGNQGNGLHGANPDWSRAVLKPRVEGLVLMAPHFFVEQISLDAIANIRQDYEKTELKKQLQKYHGDQVDDAFWGWNDVWLNPLFRHWDIRDSLSFIDIPMLVLQGEDDEYGTTEQVDCAVSHASGQVRTRLYPNCGHSPHRQWEELVVEDVADFVDSITEAPTS